ncbi:HpcH/HpaI aldolase family protein [Loktanella sp. Alg231-35]|uniref:HpcH/HpaI aldolase family protein n=1 Tax=Loktanella sp. Alg231-35 TaxID=1922220 RepID=UPI000D550946|nr:aldolase/citrate lyase family protein [Loktanella sp. Alg231-35]
MINLKLRLNETDALLSAHVCTIPSATVTQALAAAGADAVIIDMEHGAVDYGSAHAMIAATQGTNCAPIVRVAENDPVQVKRVLDLGAQGICFPMIRTADDARAAVAALRYPPLGNRGFGPFVAHSGAGVSLLDYKDAVDGTLTCILLVETADAIDNIEEIATVPGIDLLVPAQFDLSTDLGISGQFEHPDFQAAIAKVEKAAASAGIPLGNVALSEAQADGLIARGYRVICGFDLLWLKAKTAEAQAWLGKK